MLSSFVPHKTLILINHSQKMTLRTAKPRSHHDNTKMTDIVLCTLNAKYIHASLGLRYLLANMGELQAQTLAVPSGSHCRAQVVERNPRSNPHRSRQLRRAPAPREACRLGGSPVRPVARRRGSRGWRPCSSALRSGPPARAYPRLQAAAHLPTLTPRP